MNNFVKIGKIQCLSKSNHCPFSKWISGISLSGFSVPLFSLPSLAFDSIGFVIYGCGNCASKQNRQKVYFEKSDGTKFSVKTIFWTLKMPFGPFDDDSSLKAYKFRLATFKEWPFLDDEDSSCTPEKVRSVLISGWKFQIYKYTCLLLDIELTECLDGRSWILLGRQC